MSSIKAARRTRRIVDDDDDEEEEKAVTQQKVEEEEEEEEKIDYGEESEYEELPAPPPKVGNEKREKAFLKEVKKASTWDALADLKRRAPPSQRGVVKARIKEFDRKFQQLVNSAQTVANLEPLFDMAGSSKERAAIVEAKEAKLRYNTFQDDIDHATTLRQLRALKAKAGSAPKLVDAVKRKYSALKDEFRKKVAASTSREELDELRAEADGLEDMVALVDTRIKEVKLLRFREKLKKATTYEEVEELLTKTRSREAKADGNARLAQIKKAGELAIIRKLDEYIDAAKTEAVLTDAKIMSNLEEERDSNMVLPMAMARETAKKYIGTSGRLRARREKVRKEEFINAFPREEDWPALDSAELEPFVNRMLKPFHMPPAEQRNNCTQKQECPMRLQGYQQLIPFIVGPFSPLKRLLVVASTGAGKTCTIHNIASLFYKKAVAMGETPPKIVVIVPGLPQENEIKVQALCCPGPVNDFVTQNNLSQDNERDKARAWTFMKNTLNLEILTYAKAGNALGKSSSYFDNAVVLMDEVHNLVNKPVYNAETKKLVPAFKNAGSWKRAIVALYNAFSHPRKSFRNATVVGFTATPIVDGAEDLLLLVNTLFGTELVKPETFQDLYIIKEGPHKGELTRDPARLNYLRKQLRHTMAIYDNKLDVDKFPRLVFKKYQEVPYSASQWEKVPDKKGGKKSDWKNPLLLVNVVPHKMSEKERGQFKDDAYLEKTAPKLKRILDTVLSLPGKQIVFSDQKWSGAEGFLELLLQRNFKLYPRNSCKTQAALRGGAEEDDEDDEVVEPVVEVRCKPINTCGDTPGCRQVLYLGEKGTLPTSKQLGEFLGAFNSPENANGEIIPIAILSSKFAEGVNFKGVRAIHFMEQIEDVGRFEQVLGRARRFCSHAALEYPDEWNVDIYQYLSVNPDGTSPSLEQNILHKRAKAAKLKNSLLELAGSVAMDCVANKLRTSFKCKTFTPDELSRISEPTTSEHGVGVGEQAGEEEEAGEDMEVEEEEKPQKQEEKESPMDVENKREYEKLKQERERKRQEDQEEFDRLQKETEDLLSEEGNIKERERKRHEEKEREEKERERRKRHEQKEREEREREERERQPHAPSQHDADMQDADMLIEELETLLQKSSPEPPPPRRATTSVDDLSSMFQKSSLKSPGEASIDDLSSMFQKSSLKTGDEAPRWADIDKTGWYKNPAAFFAWLTTLKVPTEPPVSTVKHWLPARVVVVGDVHGDIDSLLATLFRAHVINFKGVWIGGQTTVVQLGDQVDRKRGNNDIGPQTKRHPELEVLQYTEHLRLQASRAGGMFYSLLGNHELSQEKMNGKYVSAADLADYGNSVATRNNMFRPGSGDLARKLLAKRQVALIIGNWVFSHGDLVNATTEEHVDAYVTHINRVAHKFLTTGKGGDELQSESSPIWNRQTCINCGRCRAITTHFYASAHTGGNTIRSCCDKKVWCVDTLRSLAFKQPGISDAQWHKQRALALIIEHPDSSNPTVTIH